MSSYAECTVPQALREALSSGPSAASSPRRSLSDCSHADLLEPLLKLDVTVGASPIRAVRSRRPPASGLALVLADGGNAMTRDEMRGQTHCRTSGDDHIRLRRLAAAFVEVGSLLGDVRLVILSHQRGLNSDPGVAPSQTASAP